ncbi:MAG: protoporphyrinogen oxidase [gamma proteobacterium symbiont of Taylorina sp.]|nr:protoporphyrinogen oxidase [gamma proteobacterium symbiont of Taylorina sp.]
MRSSTAHEYDVDVLVIGGGISGLTTASYLSSNGLSVQIWEKTDRAGGKIKTNHTDGFQTEQAASMVMNFRPEVDQFLQQTGLEQYKIKRSLKSENQRYLIHQGKLQSLPMTIGRLFLSPLWSTSGKFRLLMEPFIFKGTHSNETVTEFVSRRFGSEFLEKAMEPFISGTLASDPDLACAQYVIPRLTALEKKYGSITAGIFAHKILGKRTARNPESFSFKDGMETLTKRLAANPVVGFQYNYQVQKIIQHGHYHWEVQASTPEGDIQCKSRHVVITSPAETAARLLSPLSQTLSDTLSSIKYTSLSVVHLGYEQSAVKHSLDSAGFLVPRQEKMNINGNLWMSSIFSGLTPDKHILLSSYLGGTRHPSAINLSHQQSIEQVIEDINSLLNINDSPVMTRVDKHPKALPLYHGNYHQKLLLIKEQLQTLAGLHIEANYKGGISIRDRIVSAEKTANKIIHHLHLGNEPERLFFSKPSLRPVIS